MNPSQYSLDNEWISARERLIALEKNLDQMTITYLREIGVRAGWRCLEIGAGGGSIADWLCHQVGATGHVTATDINTRFLDAFDHSNLEVRQHNLESDDLPEDAFDVVHARVVQVHLKEPDRAVKKLARAVRPGGWILLEEHDHVATVADPLGKASSQALFNKVIKVFHAAYRQRGQDINFGKHDCYGSRRTHCEHFESALERTLPTSRWATSCPIGITRLLSFQLCRNHYRMDRCKTRSAGVLHLRIFARISPQRSTR
jgi:ubiquinone/menaquinone biosynthesis C-methylase UbiE